MDHIQVLVSVLGVAQKTSYLDMEQVASSRLQMNPAVRMLIKWRQLQAASQHLKTAFERVTRSITSEQQRFAELTRATQAFRLVRTDGQLLVNVGIPSRIVRPPNPDHDCTLAYSPTRQCLQVTVPIPLRANAILRVYVHSTSSTSSTSTGGMGPDGSRSFDVHVPPPPADWQGALNAARRHVRLQHLFDTLVAQAGSLGPTAVMVDKTTLQLDLGAGLVITIRLHFSDIPGTSSRAAAATALAVKAEGDVTAEEAGAPEEEVAGNGGKGASRTADAASEQHHAHRAHGYHPALTSLLLQLHHLSHRRR